MRCQNERDHFSTDIRNLQRILRPHGAVLGVAKFCVCPQVPKTG